MNILRQGLDFLAQQRKTFASEKVEYHRFSNGDVLSVSATPGKTLFRTDDVSGFTIRVHSFDFLILSADLPFEPEKGDVIIYQGGRYEVLAPENEPVWRWSGNNQDTYRVHSKFVGTEQEGMCHVC